MKNGISLGISGRLFALSIAVSIALGALGVYAYTSLHAAGDLAKFTEQNRVPQLEAMSELELNVTQVSLQLRHAILARTPEERAATLTYIGAKRQHMDGVLKAFEERLFSPEGRAHFTKLPPQLANFWRIGEANLALIQQDRLDEAFAYLVDTTIPARDALLTELANGSRIQAEGLSLDIDRIAASVNSTSNLIAGAAVLIAATLLLFAWFVARTLRARTAIALAAVERVRDGDLTQAVQDAQRDELSPVLKALDDMQTSLTRVVGNVRQGADSVATASVQIAQGNSDLSGRTEQQASALEQTSASMEQLGTTSRQNADNAQLASQLATTASSVAQQGGQVVEQVVETMKAINHSSQKISDIIGTIDGIAFQTNILALNAAVEAARAGEQGRGFAVVAGEVRTLAQRSAEAAKEIKGLIGASVERVEQGSQLVDQAGSTMKEILSSVQRVSDIVGEISSASHEQNAGVAQVSQAVTQMDQTTQQNAALVEESAAAASSLRQQAQQLVEAVGVFRLASGGSSGFGAATGTQGTAAGKAAALPAAQPQAVRVMAAAAPRALARPTSPSAPASRKAPAKEEAGEWESF